MIMLLSQLLFSYLSTNFFNKDFDSMPDYLIYFSTIGIGGGQPSRVDSCKIAVEKARTFQPKKMRNSIAASDAFFPFPDGIKKLIKSGVKLIIQPGGSIRDKEIIKFANDMGIVLVFSKTRHFRH